MADKMSKISLKTKSSFADTCCGNREQHGQGHYETKATGGLWHRAPDSGGTPVR